MLLSFVSAWADDPAPAITSASVKVKGAADQTIVLKAVGLMEANGYAILAKGSVAPVAYETAAATSAYGSKQEIFKATTNEDGSLTLTSVTGTPIALNEAGYYFVKVTVNSKAIFVPFLVVTSLEKQVVWDKSSFDQYNKNGGFLKGYFNRWGDWQEGWNVTASATDLTQQYWRYYDSQDAYDADMLANPGQTIIPSWYAVAAAGTSALELGGADHRDAFPWIGTVLPSSDVAGTQFRVLATGTDKTDGQNWEDLGTRAAGGYFLGDKTDFFNATGLAERFKLNIKANANKVEEGGVAKYYGAEGLGTVYKYDATTQLTADEAKLLNEALSAADYTSLSNVQLWAAPAEGIYGGFKDGAYAGLFDYSWTMSPISNNYDPTKEEQKPTIYVNAKYANGDDYALQAYVPGATGDQAYKTYFVKYYTDAACTKEAAKVHDARIYYVKVFIFTGTEEVEEGGQMVTKPCGFPLDVKQYVISGTGVEFTLKKLEKNYGDDDPVFEDWGPAGWLYMSADGNYKSFYTLKDLNGTVIPTTAARLVGVKFQRVDTGEEVYTASGLGSYSYTVPLTGLKIVSANPANAAPVDELTEADWEFMYDTNGKLKPSSSGTYTENYQILNDVGEKLHIVQRDLSLLEDKLTIGDVIYNRAKFTAINPMDAANATAKTDEVNVKGLFFTSNKKDDNGNNITIPVDPYATKKVNNVDVAIFDVTVTTGAENENVSYDATSGSLAQKGSLTITAKPGNNFTGSVTIPFTVRPRNISVKVPNYKFENGFIKLVGDQPVLNDPAEKDNPFGGWSFKAYGNGAPIYNGVELIPSKDGLYEATCASLKGVKKTLDLAVYDDHEQLVSGDYTIASIDGVNYIDANVNANGTAARQKGQWVDGAFVPEKVGDVIQTYAKAKVKIQGIGNFCGEREVEYAIYPKALTQDKTQYTYIVGATTYDGTVQTPTVNVIDLTWGQNTQTSHQLATPAEFTLSSSATAAGEGTVTVEGQGNYCGSVPQNFVNNGKVLEIAFSADALKKTYGEQDPDFNSIYTISNLTDAEKYAQNKDAETSAIKPYLDEKGIATDDVTKAAESDLVKNLKKAITFSREKAGKLDGEIKGFYAISFTVDPAVLTPYEEDDKVVPFKYVYGNYVVKFNGFAAAVEADPEHEIAAAEAQAPMFEIEKRPLTVTALPRTEEFGTIDGNTDFTFMPDPENPGQMKKAYTIDGWATGQIGEYNFDLDDEASVINAKADGTAKIVVKASTRNFQANNNYTLTPDVDPSGTLLDNYTFNWKSAVLSVTPATLKIIAEDKTIKYGEEGKRQGTIVEGTTAKPFYTYTIFGYQYAPDATDAQKQIIETDIRRAVGDPFRQGSVIPEPEEGEADKTHGGRDVGTYVIDVARNDEGVPTTAPTQYENYAIVYVPAELEIEQARLDVTALEQTIGYGDEIVTDIIPAGNNATIKVEGLQYEDKVQDFTITLSRLDEPAKTAVGVYDPAKNNNTAGIKVTVAPKDNYDIHVHFGKLTIAGGELALYLNRPYLGTKYEYNADKKEFEADGNLWAVTDKVKAGDLESDRVYDEEVELPELKEGASQARGYFRTVASIWENGRLTEVNPAQIPNTADQLLQDFNGQIVDVHFGDFNFYKDRWYTLVLPFDITVSAISRAFGYALVDVLDVRNTDGQSVTFRQYIHDIPANTPFLIKVPENINMKDVVFQGKVIIPVLDADGKQVVENDVPQTQQVDGFRINYLSEAGMKAAAEAFNATAAAQKATDKNVPLALKDLAGNIIVGTYLGKYGLEAGKETTIGASGVSVLKKTATPTAYVYPFGAYFRVADATAQGNIRLVIEEADGTMTVIDAVEVTGPADGAFAEGWYTITGVKLTSEPTVTGTYIYNGKKVFFQAK